MRAGGNGLTFILGFYKSDFWHFGRWNSAVWLISTPVVQFLIYRGDLVKDAIEVRDLLEAPHD